MIVCVCRGATDKQVMNAIDNGASSLRDLQRCGIGDQCGSCHKTLRMMLAAAAPARPRVAAGVVRAQRRRVRRRSSLASVACWLRCMPILLHTASQRAKTVGSAIE